MPIPCQATLFGQQGGRLPDMLPIKDFDGYFITSDGQVYSTKKREIPTRLYLKTDKDGYLYVGMYKGKKRYFRRINRLVAGAYIPNPNDYPMVNHKNGIKDDNRVDNLEWCNGSMNKIHAHQVLGIAGNVTVTRPITLLDKASGEEIKFKTSIDCSKFLGITNIHLARLLNGKNALSNARWNPGL